MNLLFLLMLALAAAVVAAPPTQAVVLALAGIAAIFSPLALKLFPWTGPQMTAFTMLVALGLALLASWLTGELVLSREGIVNWLLYSSATWSLQQAAYAVLKQTAPALVTTPPPAAFPAPKSTT